MAKLLKNFFLKSKIIQCLYTLILKRNVAFKECKDCYNKYKFEINCLVVGHCVMAVGIIAGYWCIYLSGSSFIRELLGALVGYIIIGIGVLILTLPVIFAEEEKNQGD